MIAIAVIIIAGFALLAAIGVRAVCLLYDIRAQLQGDYDLKTMVGLRTKAFMQRKSEADMPHYQ